MDWNRIEGNWKQLRGAAKEQWGKLTDEDLHVIEGRREQLEGTCSSATVLPKTRFIGTSTTGSRD
jgi:uncharacterized protein YjbJ (UPF0337 family)